MSEILRNYPLKDLQKGKKIGKFHFDSEETALSLYIGAIHYGIRNILEGRADRKNHDQDMVVLVLKAFGVSAASAKTLSLNAHSIAWQMED